MNFHGRRHINGTSRSLSIVCEEKVIYFRKNREIKTGKSLPQTPLYRFITNQSLSTDRIWLCFYIKMYSGHSWRHQRNEKECPLSLIFLSTLYTFVWFMVVDTGYVYTIVNLIAGVPTACVKKWKSGYTFNSQPCCTYNFICICCQPVTV